MRLFYRQPAARWEETLPVGNGKQGGMVWGTVPEERIGLNDENLWSGYPRDKNRPHGGACLEEVREKIFRAVLAGWSFVPEKGICQLSGKSAGSDLGV